MTYLARVILVSPNNQELNELESALKDCAAVLVQAKSKAELFKHLNDQVAAIFISIQVITESKVDMLATIQARCPNCAINIFSDKADVEQVVRAIKKGAFWFLKKPFEPIELNNLLNIALELYNLRSINADIQQIVAGAPSTQVVISESSAMQATLSKIYSIAGIDSTVLLTGESGTGKSVLARIVHNLSSRSKKPFVAFSCAAIPRDLLEAELFGYVRGAFTGADSSRAGYVELAQGGTLFLDEIGELSLELQPKLLTFLQNKSFSRLGSTEVRPVDVRIIAATNRNLEAMCQEGSFREDLYFRINVLAIKVPALRERQADIPALIEYFLKRISLSRKTQLIELNQNVVNALTSYHWPGNVRQLENLLERVTAFAKNGNITVEDLGLDHTESRADVSNFNSVPGFLGRSLADIEKDAIKQTLNFHSGDKLKTAAMLGVSLKTVYNMIKKYELM